MPSASNPNSPFLASRLQADLGVHAPGTPTQAGKPGVQAGDLSFPAPPGPSAAPAGRPPAAPTPQASTPQAATPQAKPVAAPTAAATPAAPGAAPAQSAQPAAAGAAPAAPTTPPPLGFLAGTSPQGEEQYSLSPDGDMRYRQAILQKRQALGPLPKLFRQPTLPEMPIELGQSNYNPFTGLWG